MNADISEEDLLAIAATLGAYLGVHCHIRQIRLISSDAWALDGRQGELLSDNRVTVLRMANTLGVRGTSALAVNRWEDGRPGSWS